MILTEAKSWLQRPAGRFVGGLLLLFIGLCFYWQSLVDTSAPVSAPIPRSELKLAGQHSVSWVLPAHLRSGRWLRTGVRVWEAKQSLPLRVDAPALVARLGAGRFCVAGDRLFFSASDDSSPDRNGRNYRLEVMRPSHRSAVFAGACVLVSAVVLLVLPWREWRQRIAAWLGSPEHRQTTARWAGMLLVLCAALLLLQRHQPWTVHRALPVPQASLIHNANGVAAYHLPKWIAAHPYRWERVAVVANGKPLHRVDTESLNTRSGVPGYAVSNEAVTFRPGVGATVGDEALEYRLDVVLFGLAFFNPAACSWWALLLLGLGVLALGSGAAAGAVASARRRTLGWWVPIVLVTVCKLWLVSGDEVIGQVADSLNYARGADDLVWFGGGELPTHPSGFPFVAALCAQLGVPWRLGVELLYLASCCWCALVVRALTRSRLAGFLLFFFLAWHPWSLSGFREFMSDPLVLVLQLAILGSVLRLLQKPLAHWAWSQLTLLGLLLSLWQWSRYEQALLAAGYGVFVIFALMLSRRETCAPPLRSFSTAARVLLPVLIVIVVAVGVKFVNRERFGVRSKSLIDAPGLTALMKSLYRVRPSQTLRYAPVTRQSLSAACAVSPSLAPFQSQLLNSNLAPVQLGQAITKEPGEFGPYLLWLLPQQVLPNDRRAANRTLLKAAGEVEAALRAGRLPGRTAWYPLDPNWRVWLPELPRSFAMRLREGTSCLPPGEPWGTYKGAFVQHTFDNGATRRTANTHTNRFLLEGVLFGSPGVIDSVAVADDNGRWLGATSVAASNWWEHGQAFDMRVPAPDEASGCRVVFLKNGQPQHSARLELKPVQAGTDQGFSRMAELRGLRVPLPQSSDIFGFYLHVGITHSVRAERRAAWERMLGAYYPQALNGGLVLALLAVLISSKAPAYGIGAQGCSGRPEAKPSQASMGRLLLCGFLLVSVWLVARAAFYGLVEANMGWGVVRYMRCVSPLFILVLFLAASWAGSCLGFIWLYFVRCRTKIVCPYNQFC